MVMAGYGSGSTKYGPGVQINITADEAAHAIDVWLHAQGYIVRGPRTITMDGKLLKDASIYVDPSGFVITPESTKLSGRGIHI
jgi:hypothetical protein